MSSQDSIKKPKKRHFKELPVLAIARALYNYISGDEVLQWLAGAFGLVLVAYFVVLAQESWRGSPPNCYN